ncbi:MAG: N5-carboxyaminoimidazole ribonucleotide synthase [Cytophagales bacterium]|jgi:5-(carboxyamino)imidazole ribonucleotide synthase|nr:5-(carboxyamino)imidazole ribonucleotide synthase [Bacteroidota bacterium]MBS1979980.1 5-(carboxyamino)imidazole ribonucleotide synthase [Bacteroidota bacterium]WHZ07273.1 MAG: N5-carboxyaminoimidazole ribonucleotide synthase [Cytophagales bacterium]
MAHYRQPTVGILGGGQLGRMLIQSGMDWNIFFSVLDPDPQAPCRSIAEFRTGQLTDYSTVLDFGKTCELITIEIENVNVAALKELVRLGKKVFPQPEVIELIQDKRTQKKFYRETGIPTADFMLVENAEQVRQQKTFLPAVNKLGREGYDGRGVQILKNESDLVKAFDSPGILEKLVKFEKEISVIVARNESGEVKTFPAVEMVFHPVANLVEYLFSPASISEQLSAQAELIAKKIITGLNMVGLLAVEMFVTKDQQLLVNEIAPRPHNSGHQTIEGNITSQYQQHLRAVLNLPLGDTSTTKPSAMVNLLGEEGFSGEAKFQGLPEVLELNGTYVHLYGKKLTKPFRKMGHVTVVDSDPQSLIKKVNFVKQTLKIIA